MSESLCTFLPVTRMPSTFKTVIYNFKLSYSGRAILINAMLLSEFDNLLHKVIVSFVCFIFVHLTGVRKLLRLL